MLGRLKGRKVKGWMDWWHLHGKKGIGTKLHVPTAKTSNLGSITKKFFLLIYFMQQYTITIIRTAVSMLKIIAKKNNTTSGKQNQHVSLSLSYPLSIASG